MDQKITQLLQDQGENYILPFFWQHGEDEATLREYMGAIHACGIGAVCVESRPHPDFCGPKWWTDLDVIMDEARSRGMRVWVLDDSHFPTGFANGAVANAADELCKQFLHFKEVEVCGPLPSAQLEVASLAKYFKSPFEGSSMFRRSPVPPRSFDDDRLLAVCAMNVKGSRLITESCIDLTCMVSDGQLIWDVPQGMWRIFVLYLTRNAGLKPHYINVIDRRSCRLQIDAVYEPHYARYAADFGKTFAGFFSDEPEFGNTSDYRAESRIGSKMLLPWSVEVPGRLSEKLGLDWATQLPALWYEASNPDVTARVRYAYMDTITRLVEQDFSFQLGAWCEQHGVEYIGHTIEDNNQHARLGQSFGHYFRGLGGQHMAGIDDIGGQVVVGGEDHIRPNLMGLPMGADGEFYHYALGKLGASHAHIDPRKQGRAMCEIFGAYGWGTGVRTMKYLTDHFLVRGVNYYVPHAFSPKQYPDPDCPPHFYAHGHNPQYRHFQRLMRYMNRVCNLISEGVHIAPVALLYHGEGEWTGDAMFTQQPARELAEHQIDFDILPSDVFAETERYKTSFGKTLKVNNEAYKVLVVPYTQYITSAVAQFSSTAKERGFEVIFVDALPDGVCDGDGSQRFDLSGSTIVPLKALAGYLAQKKYPEVEANPGFRRLRYYHYRRESDLYMFSNEDPGKTYQGEVTVPQRGKVYAYDAWENLLRPQPSEPCSQGTKLFLEIPPYQSVIVLFDDPGEAELQPLPAAIGRKQGLGGGWTLSLAKSMEYPNFHDERLLDRLESVALSEPGFSGFMRYEKTFTLEACTAAVLEIRDAYEGVEVWVNDQYAGLRICPPFRFDICDLVRRGENRLRIEVANTLQREVLAMPKDPNDFFSKLFASGVLAPSGMVGEVNLYLK